MAVHWGGRGPGHMGRGLSTFNPLALFAAGEKGVILLPENSDVSVGSGVGTVTDTSGNSKNATQGTGASKPILRQNATTGALYWEFDGSNDWLQTAAIDLSNTDKVTVFAGARKLSDAAVAVLAEFSADTNANAGSFYFTAPEVTGASGDFRFKSRGSTNPSSVTSGAFLAPVSAVLTGIGDIVGDSAILRLNGSQVSNGTGNQGTGNFGNYPVYIGRRGGLTLPFNGHIYGLIVIGRTCTAAEIAAVEAFFNHRIGAF